LDYCHNGRVIHRDIKFQNVILLERVDELPTAKTAPSKIHVKIADFGIFGSNKGTVAERHNAGSIKYMSPELLQGDNASDPKIDIWALGVLMYAMIIGQCPFDGSTREKIKEIVIN
jgi:serine/threonine protein kinase